jgi:hypothetical protein
MGSYATISIGKYEYISLKSYLSPLLLIFNTWDRRIENYIEDDEEFTSYKYITSVKLAKQCLDVSGYRISKTKEKFESNKLDMEHYFEYEYDENMDDAIKKYDFDNWYLSIKHFAHKFSSEGFPWDDRDKAWINKIKKDNVSDFVVGQSFSINSDFYWGFPEESTDYWNVFRVILDAFEDDEQIILDYSDLVNGGYCDEIQDENDFVSEKIIILTEGISDSEFILRSIKILYPHLRKFYYFMEFETMKVSGGVSYLTHYIKAFAGAKISNMIIGLFDNDSAPNDELRNLRGICLPPNIRISKLPEIDIAKKYPTIGPMQNQDININGMACSIELFFGKDILQQDDGTFTPVRWTGYKDRIDQYQGEIKNKDGLQRKFRHKLDLAEKSQQIKRVEWEDMITLIECIIHAFD